MDLLKVIGWKTLILSYSQTVQALWRGCEEGRLISTQTQGMLSVLPMILEKYGKTEYSGHHWEHL
jgi:hypothetical protein